MEHVASGKGSEHNMTWRPQTGLTSQLLLGHRKILHVHGAPAHEDFPGWLHAPLLQPPRLFSLMPR